MPLDQAVSEGPLQFFGMNGAVRLREVIVGPRCHASVDVVRDFVGALPDIVTFGSRLAIESFGVVPDENTVP